MGGTLGRRLLESRSILSSDLAVSNPHTAKLADLEEAGVTTDKNNRNIIKGADLIVIAVKPWVIPQVIDEIKDQLEVSTEVCLFVAGIPGMELIGFFGENVPENISIGMPNTAMKVGESMTFITPLKGKPEKAMEIFSYCGEVMVIPERQLKGGMALASCGIAYAMRYIRAACEGGVELGFKASEAKEIVAQTLKGAVALLNSPDSHPEVEIDKVTTPGGITIKGLNAMEKMGFSASVIEGLKVSGQ